MDFKIFSLPASLENSHRSEYFFKSVYRFLFVIIYVSLLYFMNLYFALIIHVHSHRLLFCATFHTHSSLTAFLVYLLHLSDTVDCN